MRKSFSFYLLISALLCFTAISFADEEAYVRQLVQRYQSGQQLTPAEKEIVSAHLSAGVQTINAHRGRNGRIVPEGSQAIVLGPETFDVWPPAGWTVTDNGNGNAWGQTTNAAYNGGTDNFAYWDDDAWGLGSVDATTMTTSAFSTVGLTNGVSLTFDYGYRALGGAPYSVEVSNDSGTTWQTVIADLPATSVSANAQYPEAANFLVDITAAAGENPNVMVRFAFDDLGGWQWYGAIDNVTVSEAEVDLAVTQFVGLSSLVGASQTINVNVEVASIGALDADGTTLELYKNGVLASSATVDPLASGVSDTIAVSFTSSASGTDELVALIQAVTGDGNQINDTLSATVTISNAIPLPFTESWPTTTLDPGFWPAAGQAGTPDVEPFPGAATYPMPSDPNVLNIHGPGTILTSSSLFDLSTVTDSLVLAMYESENDLEIGESVFLEYQLADGSWAVLHEFVGTDNGFNVYEAFELVVFDLPADAYHSAFAFRWRAFECESTDEWFFDDIYLGSPDADPIMVISPASFSDTVLVGGSLSFDITVNNAATLPASLDYTVTLDAGATWLSAAPLSGSVSTGNTDTVAVTLDASALTANTYTADIIISGNDSTNLADTVSVTMIVNDAPVMAVTPDSLIETLGPTGVSTQTMTITNNGSGPLDFAITTEGADLAKVEFIGTNGIGLNNNVIARGKPYPIHKLTKNVRNTSPAEADINLSSTPNNGLIKIGGTEGVTIGEEIFGSNANAFGPSGLRGRGNLFTCTNNTTMTEHRLYLNVTASTDLYFVVAESDAQVGDYTVVSVSDVSPSATGEGWYSSGSINVPMVAGKYYLVFAQWDANANYYNEQNISPYPVVASFGELTAGAGWSTGSVPAYANPPAATHPIAATAFAEPVAYYQTIVTGPVTSWVTLGSESGTVPANSSVDVSVTFSGAGQVAGDYFADIIVSGNDPLNPTDTVAAKLTVTGAVAARVNPDSVFFAGTTFAGGTAVDSFWVANDGNDSLIVSSLTSSSSAFTVVDDGFVVSPFDSSAVYVTFMPTAAGVESGTVTITTTDPNNPTLDVYVEAEGVDPPVMVIDPDSISETLDFLDSLDFIVSISNETGGATLDWVADIQLMPYVAKQRRNVIAPGVKPDVGVAASSDRSPNARAVSSGPTEAPFDLILSFNLDLASGAAGNAGSEFDGTYFYTTRWASNLIHKYDTAGNLVEEFSIAGVTGLRDLAFDGTFMYGGAAGTTIYQMDFTNKLLVGSITGVAQPVRHISYDSGADGFWVGNWDTDVVLVNRSGATVSTISAATHGLGGMYGSAYDEYSAGGPYLWLYDQGLGAGTPQLIHQFNVASGTATGLTFDTALDFPGAGGIAGGLFVSADYVSGLAVVGGVLQGTPDNFFVYELAETGTPWMVLLSDGSGSIAAGDIGAISLRLSAAVPDTTFEGYIEITGNDPSNASQVVKVFMTVTDDTVAIKIGDVIPNTFDISDNYPNPFNPTTTMEYKVPKVSDVSLIIYNVLGQKVRTLVKENTQPGTYQVEWDGRNDFGAQVASGVYIYRFEASDYQQVRKMILLK